MECQDQVGRWPTLDQCIDWRPLVVRGSALCHSSSHHTRPHSVGLSRQQASGGCWLAAACSSVSESRSSVQRTAQPEQPHYHSVSVASQWDWTENMLWCDHFIVSHCHISILTLDNTIQHCQTKWSWSSDMWDCVSTREISGTVWEHPSQGSYYLS